LAFDKERLSALAHDPSAVFEKTIATVGPLLIEVPVEPASSPGPPNPPQVLLELAPVMYPNSAAALKVVLATVPETELPLPAVEQPHAASAADDEEGDHGKVTRSHFEAPRGSAA
jgi:hypothetical protein